MISRNVLAVLCGSMLMAQAYAAPITPAGASVVTGVLSNLSSVDLIIDGYVPVEGSHYMGIGVLSPGLASTAMWGTGVSPAVLDAVLEVDQGAVYRLEDILVSVDNNDDYTLSYSATGLSFQNLFSIPAGVGEISSGMDTFSTLAGDAEFAGPDFAPVDARYVRITAAGGDSRYSVGELQAFGTPLSAGPTDASVPVPAPLGLLSLGMLSLALRRRG